MVSLGFLKRKLCHVQKRCFHLEHLQNQTLEEKHSAWLGRNVFVWIFWVDSYFIFKLFHNKWLFKIFRDIHTKTVSKHWRGKNHNFTDLIFNHDLTYFVTFSLSLFYFQSLHYSSFQNISDFKYDFVFL